MVLLTVGVAVPSRHFYKRAVDLAALLVVTTSLAACAGAHIPFFDKSAPQEAATVDAMDANGTPHTAPPVAVAALDPINAAPPGGGAKVAAAPSSNDPLLVPAPTAATPKADSSQRVPLGTFGAAAPASGAPVSIMQPPVKPPTSPSALAENKLEQSAAVIQPRPAPSAAPPASAPMKMPVTAPLVPAKAPTEKPKAPVLRLPQSSGATPAPPSADDAPQDTVIISSTTAKPVIQNREFVPASVIAGQNTMPSRGLGDIPMTGAEKNVVQRFEILRRLQDEGLITQDEYNRRRNANIGALLPYTREPAGIGLERSVPSSDAIIARLAALRRSFEMRAISATQHALERSMILNALLPETPEDRTDRRPPPADVIEGAAMVGHLENLRAKNLITSAELDAEHDAIEHVLRTGLLPSQEKDMAGDKKAGVKMAAAAKPKGAMPAASDEADASTAEIKGPVLHLASFRSEESAKKGWQEVISRNKTALGSLKPIIRKIDLGPEKGIFYRLMAGTFNSLAEAESVCIQLKQNNQFCRASADGS